MTAAPRFSLPERYDTSCAFCGDGEPVGRMRGKAICDKCVQAVGEDGSSPRIEYGPARPMSEPKPYMDKRRILRKTGREYMEPLYIRALKKRKSYIP